ncbi:hypothetical protein EV581_103758 [Bacillus sp. BK006]|uniref:hypothetical protein n=1 Tax=Priestia megaterium TaxID=1404 RepID=UPI00104D25B3|nr:hypothetical protein [Priestia megaterium]MCM3183750.1 hypothetical protein [Priestia megaterium]TCN12383.1 hypothetical protein EV581_103758 [Bacillus sp. BK006]
MTEPIKIIRDLDSLQGTCYVEIKPGKYTGEHWTKESIFFTDETFTYFSSTIEKYYKKYSLWGMSEISRETWKLIVEELENLKLFLMDNPKADELKNHIGFFYLDSTEKKFKENLNQHVSDLVQVISEFQTWITEKSKNNGYISILGI